MEKRTSTHPGIILKEFYLDKLGIGICEFAEIIGISRITLSRIIHARAPVTPQMAVRFSKALPNTSVQMWMNLQSNYDLSIAEKSISFANIKPIIMENPNSMEKSEFVQTYNSLFDDIKNRAKKFEEEYLSNNEKLYQTGMEDTALWFRANGTDITKSDSELNKYRMILVDVMMYLIAQTKTRDAVTIWMIDGVPVFSAENVSLEPALTSYYKPGCNIVQIAELCQLDEYRKHMFVYNVESSKILTIIPNLLERLKVFIACIYAGEETSVIKKRLRNNVIDITVDIAAVSKLYMEDINDTEAGAI